ncbi:UDP-3-O-(3-hydroxymyristoyl)glucosamine N-acyltransferase [Candidatus Poribacteria bacterium]|nr:UDP-3-O-(3-hydroxymyristoyl)glucosamine N-acyltransferase [Candidatus Poribacteria bacterium]
MDPVAPVKMLSEIAELIDATLIGDGSTKIHGVSGIREAKAGEITFVANSKYIAEIAKTQASAIIVGADIDLSHSPTVAAILRVPAPYLAFVRVLEIFAFRKRRTQIGIDSTAIVGSNVRIGENVSIQPYVVIGDNVEIGDDTTIGPFVYVGDDSRIGSGCLVYPNVTIREEVSIGNRVIIHSGAVVGSDGFGFAKVSDWHHKIPQIGTVIIEDDVEIGACTTIDRATMTNGATVIGKGTKIDNLVQVAHNVVIGENCLIVAQVGLAGSTILGRNVTVAGQAGTAGHLSIGENSTVAAKAGVTKDIPPNSFHSGFPAEDHKQDLKHQAYLRRVPQLVREIEALRARIEALEGTVEADDLDPE